MTDITATVDFEAEGKQTGWLHVPHSVTRSAYGVIPVPVAVIRNGEGPRILLTAGNHGDEYEGQVALTRLVAALEPARMRGTLIVIPALNQPAALAGTRTSPLDGGNLNRAFPGDPSGEPTWKIADYVENHLIPRVSVVGDFHCGGASLDYRPHASTHFDPGAPQALKARSLKAVTALGVPHVMVFESRGGAGMPGAAKRRGAIYLGGEYGGMGALTRAGLDLTERAVRRLLIEFAMLDEPLEPLPAPQALHIFGPSAYLYAPEAGVFAPASELGDEVAAGDLCGHIYAPENPDRAPLAVHFKAGGIVVCKRHPARVEPGDCLVQLARPRA